MGAGRVSGRAGEGAHGPTPADEGDAATSRPDTSPGDEGDAATSRPDTSPGDEGDAATSRPDTSDGADRPTRPGAHRTDDGEPGRGPLGGADTAVPADSGEGPVDGGADRDAAHSTVHLGASESVARQVVDLVGDRLAQGRSLRVLGITGPPGTGKSTVAGMVAELLEARGVTVAGLAPMDGFHLSNTVLEDAGLADHKGAPDTFDVWGYVALLQRLQRGERTVFAPGYRRDLHEPIAASSAVEPNGVVITEGNYLGLDVEGWREARGCIDLLVHVETSGTELLRRLIARQEAFGRDHVDAAHWVRTVDAANITLVSGGRDRADVVIRPRPPEARPT
ncbi:AAA family ATPase [Actinomyces provencensis]|uniref:AAA family ATPase n=1 Tax=Actinomyces provencensis TaxID=1720198 RepID=UPI00098F4A17|nr:AAA family ATPase [Actinomyces provencensis]